MVTNVLIDAVGDHDPSPRCHMVVDGIGVLVDLSGLAGPLNDPAVVKLDWGPFGQNHTPCGRIYRRSANNATALIEIKEFSDLSFLSAYLDAYQVRLAEAHET